MYSSSIPNMPLAPDHPFLGAVNVQRIWEVISTEIPHFDTAPRDIKMNFYEVYCGQMLQFYERRRKANALSDLLSMNKQFLEHMMSLLQTKDTSPTKKIKIMEEQAEEPVLYKIEDIQAERQKQFDDDFQRKRAEFESAVARPAPPAIPEFAIPIQDEKITSMEELIAQTVAQRNFDLMATTTTSTSTSTSNSSPSTTSTSLVKKVTFQQDVEIETRLQKLEQDIVDLNRRIDALFHGKN